MGTRIGLKKPLQALGRLLGLEGKATMPMDISVDEVRAVVDILGGGFAGVEFDSGVNGSGDDLAGLAAKANAYAAPASFASLTRIIDTASVGNARCLAFSGNIEFDAAGALAFNGKRVWVKVTLKPDADATTEIRVMDAVFTIATTKLLYFFDMGGTTDQGFACSWNGWIPRNWGLLVYVESMDGTVFPASTTLREQVAIATQPADVQLPQ